MHHTVAIGASLTSLALICAIYYCNIFSRPASLLRSEVLAMTLLALFTGIFPLAVTASVLGLWQVATNGLSLMAVLATGADLVGVAGIFATALVFRSLVKATYRTSAGPNSITPLTPQPANSGNRPKNMKLAA